VTATIGRCHRDGGMRLGVSIGPKTAAGQPPFSPPA